jgi:hypothetical protein
MPIPFDIPEVHEGEPLSASWLNSLRRLVIRAIKLSFDPASGFIVAQGEYGTHVTLHREGEVNFGKLPSGGIASGASGDVTLYQDATMATLTSPAITVKVYNPWPDAAPTLGKCTFALRGGKYGLIGWECSA